MKNFFQIAIELLERLEAFTPRVCSGERKWQNYRISGLNKPLPVVFKGRLHEPLSPSVVYQAVIYSRRGEKHWREDRPTVDHLEVKFYPQENGSQPEAELRFMEFAKDEDCWFSGVKPLNVLRLEGQERKAILFFAPLDGDTRVVVEKEENEILFSGAAFVEIEGGQEESKYNSRKIVIQNGSGVMEIYDHRRTMSPFAAVEYIRKICGRRSFEFFNLRDFSGDSQEVKYILTDEGLKKVGNDASGESIEVENI